MNGGGWQSSFRGHSGRSVVGDISSISALNRPEGGQERGREGMCLTAMVDLQCVSFGVEVESVIKQWRGVARWREGETMTQQCSFGH
jgi:hypothetical protein